MTKQNQFFNEELLQEREVLLRKLKSDDEIRFHIKEINENLFVLVELNSVRLNSEEIKSILKANVLDSKVKEFLDYLSTHLNFNRTRHKLTTDIDRVFSYFWEVPFKIYYNDSEIKFERDCAKLECSLFFDRHSNIVLEALNPPKIIFGIERCYALIDKKLHKLSSDIPVQFYIQILKGQNVFSIEQFFSLRDEYFKVFEREHRVVVDEKILNLENFEKKEVLAPKVLEISRSSRYISLTLKYRVGEELFNVENFSYLENSHFYEKTTHIKTLLEDDKLVTYISDVNLSENVFREVFKDTRLRSSFNERTPFTAVIPLVYLEYFVQEILPNLEKNFLVEYKNGERLKVERGSVSFEIDTSLKRRLDLFEFNVRFRVQGEYFDLEFLKDFSSKNKKHIQLKNGTMVNIENIREINKWIEFLKRFEFTRKHNMYQAKTTTALELDEFLKEFFNTKTNSNQEHKTIISELKGKKSVEEITIPKNVSSVLREYQKQGVYWMGFLRKYKFGGILSDEMGLGKTIQALTTLSLYKGPHIVVCPKTLIFNWENEIKKYFPNFSYLLIIGEQSKRKQLIKKAREFDIVLTSYSLLQKDYKNYLDEEFEFGYKILDEAHYVKNMKTLSSKSVRLVKAKNIVLLTGTPLENNLEELYGTFELIMPGYLGTKQEFKREFVSKIERNNKTSLEMLQAKIRPFILRRTKSQVLKELPEKQEQVVLSQMTNKQIAIYNEVLNRVKNETFGYVREFGFGRSRMKVLSALLRLRQVCNHPGLLDKEFIGEEEISGKFSQFLELLTEVVESERKVLVFSQFTSMLDIFEKELDSRKILFTRLDGSTKNRFGVVEEFNNNPEIKVFLISLKAGGVGLNLASASAVFLFDPWWNPMVEKQAIDRAHRIGQTQRVNIYKFITKNSIEEKILKLQKRKGNLFDNLITEDVGLMKKLEWEDLMELFE